MPPSRDDDHERKVADLQAEVDRLTEELAKAHADLQMTHLILARKCVELATVTAKLRTAERVIEYLA